MGPGGLNRAAQVSDQWIMRLHRRDGIPTNYQSARVDRTLRRRYLLCPRLPDHLAYRINPDLAVDRPGLWSGHRARALAGTDAGTRQGLVCGRNTPTRPDPLTQHCRAPDFRCRPVRHVVDLPHHWHLNSLFIERKNIMKAPDKSKNQAGFFDLGYRY